MGIILEIFAKYANILSVVVNKEQKKTFFQKGVPIFLFFLFFFLCASPIVVAKPKKPPTKTKFYNFDDLLINGTYKKPQILYIDKKQKVRFERLLKLKKDFLPNLKNTEKDPSLR